MQKENRPGQQAINTDTRGSDVTPPANTVQASRRTPKKHRARTYMLRCGAGGWTENDILRHCHLSSGRNYASELERRLDILLERTDEKNPDGIGSHLRYRFTGRGDVLKVIQLVNSNAAAGGYYGLSEQDITDILNLYPDNLTAA
ncbi:MULTISPECIES: hypothetical protein [Klebsiella]|uniref:hypothetical protein n=1 Tax=Klebsiella TaxID=570 RepID=UPI0012B756D4|nr:MULTISPECIES: hypothetical protein [Klebsiella]MBZ6856840.1 hypothetical protein [Klebsiella michiganensis]MBZ7421490.1 hypothetical protein [Klebsiella michiganensis]MDS7844661.1 hypothetical protein [Klebsiella michiganensis]MDS7920737.1 hypothetical protein [Klebsiella michiganensis]MDU6715770.1 hypothetical protein [Klebsiella michiganensis]